MERCSLKKIKLLTLCMIILASSCTTLIPSKYIHYEGDRLNKSERSNLTLNFHSDLKIKALDIISKEFNREDFVISKDFKLTKINNEQFQPFPSYNLYQFNDNFDIEIPSGETFLTIYNKQFTFMAKAKHEYALFSVLFEDKSYKKNDTAIRKYGVSNWKYIMFVYDISSDRILLLQYNIGATYVN